MRTRRAFVLVVLLATSVGAETTSAASWARAEIRVAVESGLMGPNVYSFRPNKALNRRDLARIVAGITRREQVVVDPEKRVTVAQLDRALVRALGLGPAAQKVRAELRASGLRPPGRAGTEVLARLLGLRYNHPQEDDDLERLPNDPVTRAQTAYSVAKLVGFDDWKLQWANDKASSLDLPALTAWQTRVLRRAVRFVGYPYVWGGMSELAQSPFGVKARGGFDCSGFVWRVYKLERWTGAPKLGSTLRGRTTYGMSGEMPRAQRIPLKSLLPADIVFFGDVGPRSRPTQIGHMGISMGGGWMVHSSRDGVTLVPLESWWADSFAWGRRPLAEAGLS
ncbi:MAG: C40 family peptidase [Gaiellaceae bacterium]